MSARPHFGPDADETRQPVLHVVQRRIVLFLFPDVGQMLEAASGSSWKADF